MNTTDLLNELERNFRRTVTVKQSLTAVTPSCILCAGDKRKVIPLPTPMHAQVFLANLPMEFAKFLQESAVPTNADTGAMLVIPRIGDEGVRGLMDAGLEEQAEKRAEELYQGDHQMHWIMFAATQKESDGRIAVFTANPKRKVTQIEDIQAMDLSDEHYREVFDILQRGLTLAKRARRGGDMTEFVAQQALQRQSWN